MTVYDAIRPSNFIVKFLQNLPTGTYTVGSTETVTKITMYSQDGANLYETGATVTITAATNLVDIGVSASIATAGNHMLVFEFTANTYARIVYDAVGAAVACPPGTTTLTYTDTYNTFPGCSGVGTGTTVPTIATTTPPTFGNSLGQLTDQTD